MTVNLRVNLDRILKEKNMSQKELINLIREKTGKDVRAASISELFNNQRKSLNKELIDLIVEVLEIDEPNKFFSFERK